MLAHRITLKTYLQAALALIVALAGLQLHAVRAQAAAAPLQVTIGGVSAVKGGQPVSIPVSVERPIVGIGSYGLQIDFDSTALEIVSVVPNYGSADETSCADDEQGCFASHFDNEAGWLRAVWVDMTGGDRPIDEARKLFTIQAKAKGNAGTGNKPLTVDASDPAKLTFTDADMHALNVRITAGQVSVSPQTSSSPVGVPNDAKVKIVVNGVEQEDSATLTRTTEAGRSVTRLIVDADKVRRQLNDNRLRTVLLPVGDRSDVVVGQLNGALVKAMEQESAVLQIRTGRAIYTLPAGEITIDEVSKALGGIAALGDIQVNVTISEPTADETGRIEESARNGQLTLVVPPVSFQVTASYRGKTVEVHQFGGYVERAVALPEGIDPAKITTGAVLGTDGQLHHVPTRITQIDDRYYAVINSLSNSLYTVVWHPKRFADLNGHWARDAIDDLASRMIVQGATDETFDPERAITRAEFTAILMRALGVYDAKPGTAPSFADVNAQDWFHDAVVDAASYGLVKGYQDGTFKPGGVISRAEALVMLERAFALAKLPGAASGERERLLAGFSDEANIAEWARGAVATAAKLGIVQGADGKLLPNQRITRAQTAAMVQRMLVQADLINK